MSYDLWERDYGPTIERYYDVYLFAVKYVIGFSSEGFLIARDYKDSQDLKCQQAARDYISINLNPQVTADIYDTFGKAIYSMVELRKGFYCVLCDSRS